MKVLYTSDLHGDASLYEGLRGLALSASPAIIVLGGDLLPSFPPTKRYEDLISHQRTFIERFLLPFFRGMVETAFIERIFLIPGNWDLGYPQLFKERDDRLIDLDRKIYRCDNGYDLIGYPFVPPTPFRPKDYEKMDDPESPWPPQKNPSYIRSPDGRDQLLCIDPGVYLRQQKTIGEDLEGLPAPADWSRAVYVMHSPPFGTRLDLIHGGGAAGSRAIRAFIEKKQPFLTLHGHIHESPELSGTCFDRIGKTLSVNPGQAWGSGRAKGGLRAVTFEMERPWETLQLHA